MLPLKILKRSSSLDNIMSACMKHGKDLSRHPSAVFQVGQELDHPTGPINALSQYWKQRFESAGVPEPVESIEHIIAHVIGSGKEGEFPEKEFDDTQLEKLKMLCNRRLTKMPLEYVTGEKEFKKNKLKLAVPIFIPERQTEMLVDILLKHIEHNKSKVCSLLEVGCGVGAISLSLLRECNSINIIAIDTNEIACELALHNAKKLGLETRLTILHATLEDNGEITTSSNLSNNLDINFEKETFDFIVSNPPCIPAGEMSKYQKEFEDYQARDGGVDGLRVIRPLLSYSSRRLNPDGILLLEVFPTQPKKIKLITEIQYLNILKYVHTYKDDVNNGRVIEIIKLPD